MYSLRACTTVDRDLPNIELGAGLTWDRLTEVLRQEVGADAATLLAEPVPDPARGQTHWHITAEQDPVPLSALAPADQDALLRKLEQIRRSVRAHADRLDARATEADMRLAAALRAAVTVPDQDAHVWSVAGRPVLTAWGRQRASSARPTSAIVGRSAVPVQAKAAIVARAPRRAWRLGWPATLALWLAAVLLLGAIYYYLLAACAVQLPWLGPTFARCPQIAVATNLDELRDRNRYLEEAV